MKTLIGEVSCDLHHQGCYVRVSISGCDGVPLSIRATFKNFARSAFTRGRVVEVREQKRRFVKSLFFITRVFSPVDVLESNVCLNPTTENAEAFRKEQTMTQTNTMSHDRVRFFIDDCYYNNSSKMGILRDVLKQAFGLGRGHSAQFMTNGYGGFYLICRPSQFARFLIYRNEAGIKNGFIDLRAKLYTPEPPKDAYTTLAKRVELSVHQVDRVLKAMGLGQHDIEAVLEDRCDEAPEVDVSQDKHEAY